MESNMEMSRRKALLATGASITSLTGCLGSKKNTEKMPRAAWGDSKGENTIRVRGFYDFVDKQAEIWFNDVFPKFKRDFLTPEKNVRFEFFHFPVRNNISWVTANSQIEIMKQNSDWFLNDPGYLFRKISPDSQKDNVVNQMLKAGIKESRASEIVEKRPYDKLLNKDIEAAKKIPATRSPSIVIEGERISNPFNYVVISSNLSQRL